MAIGLSVNSPPCVVVCKFLSISKVGVEQCHHKHLLFSKHLEMIPR
ncbi:hypothetical protein RBWH47_03035 [Rhodopirellula baltica WH47]|uniref:Uncharacterized protein n=1 Tax=Rhodopirellula baltica WH47 TaxID=991778 RepID=F2AP15_RHOBT|nr:hypothetical protein RBWH47_03035 [Rhodopirellula baltica WH47]